MVPHGACLRQRCKSYAEGLHHSYELQATRLPWRMHGKEGASMLINYWDFKFSDYQEFWGGVEETCSYGCSCQDKEDRCCDKNNMWGDAKAECPIAEMWEQSK